MATSILRSYISYPGKKTCLPKKFGGLDIPSIQSLYHAYCCSIIWWFASLREKIDITTIVHTLPHHAFLNGYYGLKCLDLSPEFPSHVQDAVKALSINANSIGCLAWRGSGHPNFKEFLYDFCHDLQQVTWYKFFWHKNYAMRYSTFSWMALIGGLKTADMLIQRNIQFWCYAIVVIACLKMLLILSLNMLIHPASYLSLSLG
ncbi:hypothetical protein M5K25_004727 [Dendrobium thyrsiflorum]|uniref:Uncharacterized protein n=1 Tax=Dendrobium thyrsiflorum TaxID=117978 RepID=A0ABD0VFW9_DENTH